MKLALPARICPGLEVAGGTRGPLVAARLHVPEKRLAQPDGRRQIGDIVRQIRPNLGQSTRGIFWNHWIGNLLERFERDEGDRDEGSDGVVEPAWSINRQDLARHPRHECHPPGQQNSGTPAGHGQRPPFCIERDGSATSGFPGLTRAVFKTPERGCPHPQRVQTSCDSEPFQPRSILVAAAAGDSRAPGPGV